jgi:hypothetical protein
VTWWLGRIRLRAFSGLDASRPKRATLSVFNLSLFIFDGSSSGRNGIVRRLQRCERQNAGGICTDSCVIERRVFFRADHLITNL